MKIVHAADLHIDSPMRGLALGDDAPKAAVRRATRLAFERLVDHCLADEVALLLLAGDVFDGGWKDHNTGLFFADQVRRLGAVPVVMVRGNHDAEANMNLSLVMPANLTVLSARAPETVVFDDLRVAVHGRSYPRRDVDENLAATYPPPQPGLLNIGLLHTNATGSSDHAAYAPCTVTQLVDHGYDYWALGHVHERAVLHEEPWVVYPGNLQGRSVRETGPRGVEVIEVEDGCITGLTFLPLDGVRWEVASVDLAGAADWADVQRAALAAAEPLRAAAGDRTLVLRLKLVGTTPLHGVLQLDRERLRAELESATHQLEDVWIEKVHLATEAPASDASVEAGLIEALREELEALSDPSQAEVWAALLHPLAKKVPGDDPLEVLGAAGPEALADRVSALLLGGLGGPS